MKNLIVLFAFISCAGFQKTATRTDIGFVGSPEYKRQVDRYIKRRIIERNEQTFEELEEETLGQGRAK